MGNIWWAGIGSLTVRDVGTLGINLFFLPSGHHEVSISLPPVLTAEYHDTRAQGDRDNSPLTETCRLINQCKFSFLTG